MEQRWIPLPGVPPMMSASAPLMIRSADVETVRAELSSAGAHLCALSLASVTTAVDLFEQLRRILVFPQWCGSGWDSVDDAFEEIRIESSFPCFVLASGLQDLFDRDPHLALEVVVRLSELASAFANSGDQFAVIYEVE